jgi:hypothetical protein
LPNRPTFIFHNPISPQLSSKKSNTFHLLFPQGLIAIQKNTKGSISTIKGSRKTRKTTPAAGNCLESLNFASVTAHGVCLLRESPAYERQQDNPISHGRADFAQPSTSTILI